jgi:hypothetical protein
VPLLTDLHEKVTAKKAAIRKRGPVKGMPGEPACPECGGRNHRYTQAGMADGCVWVWCLCIGCNVKWRYYGGE